VISSINNLRNSLASQEKNNCKMVTLENHLKATFSKYLGLITYNTYWLYNKTINL